MPPKSKVDKKELERLIIKENLPYSEISKKLGIAINTVAQYRRKFGIQKRGPSFYPFKGKKRSKETREKISKSKIGKCLSDKHWNWKGGKWILNGYVMVKKSGHPQARKDGYVREHRLVYEKHIGRYLDSCEIVHHINGIKNDNRIENLCLTTRSEHASIHHKGIKKNRV